MLAYIKTNYKAGDTIEITTTQGVFTGAIEYVADKYIVLRQPNGQICGIAAADIHTFRAECPVPLTAQATPATQAPETESNEENLDDEAPAEIETHDEIVESAPSDQLVAQPTSIIEPKVVGHIDLDKLKQIDPKFSRRNYFRNSESSQSDNDAQDNATEEQNADTAPWRQAGYQRTPYVSAKGRITYFNPDKRYGFIHDYGTDGDLYFNFQQVADYDLYDHLHKGTKVAYSIERNAQGQVARCVHLPHTVADLLTMAEDYFDSRHYFLAQGLAEHVLDVDADNKEAKDLLEEIRSINPAPRFAPTPSSATSAQYNPCAIYSAAKKAYLAKDYAQAEELYKKAIDAGEKPESCVKDLVTLYVSRFKQALDENEKQEARTKATDFLNSHRDLLADNLTTKQFLALNYYLPILDYTNFIKAVDEILADPQVAGVLSRRVFYIWQKGIALNKMGHAEDALALVDEGLQLAPRSRQLINLRNMILHPEYFEHGFTSDMASSETEAPASSTPVATSDDEPATAPQTNAPEPTSQAEEAQAESSAKPQADDSTGEEKPDSWWESLKERME